MNVDAVIVGAGAVGCSIAFQMAEAGFKIALVDRSFPGSGTSRATQAGIGVYSKKPRPNLELNMKGSEIYPSFVARLDRDVELRIDGSFNLAMTEEEMAKTESFVMKQLATPGYKAEIMTGDDVRKMEPALSLEVVGAAFCPLDGHVNPLLYIDALARGVVRHGGRVIADAEVTGITAMGEHLWCVATTQGEMQAQWVVNSAGVGAPRIGRMVGIDIPIVPNRGHVLVTEAIPPMIKRRLQGPILIRQTANGNLLLGKSEELHVDDRTASVPVLANEAKVACRVLPGLERVRTIRVFVGVRPWPPDGMPIIGEVPGLPGFLVAVGHSGVTWSPVVGKLLTELVATGKPSMSLEPFSIARFQNKEARAD